MAIQFVGQASFPTPATSFSLTGLTGGLASAPADDDLVVLLAFVPSNVSSRPTVSTSGYTTVTPPTAPGLIAPNTVLATKVMGGSPDTSVSVSVASAARVMVFRGVDPSTPLDVAAVAASGAGPNVVTGAITPSTSGAWIVVAGVITAGSTSTDVVLSAPGDLDVFASAAMTSGTYRGAGGLGYYDGWTTGAFDPANWSSDASGLYDQYEAYTLALRPGITITEGALAATEVGADMATLSGVVRVSGALVGSDAGSDSAALAGTVRVTGSIAANEAGADTAALYGLVLVKGALTANDNGPDVAALSDALAPATGALAVTESGADRARLYYQGPARILNGSASAGTRRGTASIGQNRGSASEARVRSSR